MQLSWLKKQKQKYLFIFDTTQRWAILFFPFRIFKGIYSILCYFRVSYELPRCICVNVTSTSWLLLMLTSLLVETAHWWLERAHVTTGGVKSGRGINYTQVSPPSPPGRWMWGCPVVIGWRRNDIIAVAWVVKWSVGARAHENNPYFIFFLRDSSCKWRRGVWM